jgi:hypothetical protein
VADRDIPTELKVFLRDRIKSIWALELLLLLFRQSHRSWTVDELALELRASRRIVVEILNQFAGLAKEEGSSRFRYAPATPEIETRVEELERFYAQRPLSLMKEILSVPNSKIQSFADAFKCWKD